MDFSIVPTLLSLSIELDAFSIKAAKTIIAIKNKNNCHIKLIPVLRDLFIVIFAIAKYYKK